jgi:hypothetical protein
MTMDVDLLSGFLAESEPSHRRQLLSNLPNSSLTPLNAASNLQNATPIISASGAVSRNSPGAVISKIEDIFEAMTDCVVDEKKELVIQLKTRDKKKPKHNDSEPTKRRKKSETRTITFPSKSHQEAWKFSRSRIQHWSWMGAHWTQLHYSGSWSYLMRHLLLVLLLRKGLILSLLANFRISRPVPSTVRQKMAPVLLFFD